MDTRIEQLRKLFPKYPNYRYKQIETAFFNFVFLGWKDLTVLSGADREIIAKNISWVSYFDHKVLKSKSEPTYKALLKLVDGREIETVLIGNDDGNWTICVSSQVGCAMRCGFCATGKMGLLRNLTSDEIVDQYRFWRYFLNSTKIIGRIGNIVLMGMGEPLNNYASVRDALNLWLLHTDLGATHIVVSTVGILPQMEKILADPAWPKVRLAVSVHCADEARRRTIVPSTMADFILKLADWSRRYLKKFGNRRHHLTYEYVMLAGVNDSDEDARLLSKMVKSVGRVKVNLISYNFTDGAFAASSMDRLKFFQSQLMAAGVLATWRQSRGEDIAGACGQLIVGEKK